MQDAVFYYLTASVLQPALTFQLLPADGAVMTIDGSSIPSKEQIQAKILELEAKKTVQQKRSDLQRKVQLVQSLCRARTPCNNHHAKIGLNRGTHSAPRR